MYSFLNILSFVFNALESAYLHQINNAQNQSDATGLQTRTLKNLLQVPAMTSDFSTVNVSTWTKRGIEIFIQCGVFHQWPIIK